jgi:release factor glutamine methyltransferase
MSVSLDSQELSVLVSRLRAAGCVFAEDEARLIVSAARTSADLTAMVDRRAAGLPLEQVLGWAEFCGLRIAVGPGVFVPRRRTEFLVRHAAALAPQPGSTAGPAAHAGQETRTPAGQAGARVVVVDLCCGAGPVGVALAAILGDIELHAVDIDPAAVRYARLNLEAAGGHAYEGDLYEPLPATLRGRVGLLVVNAPYVPSDEVRLLPAEARVHEPLVALDGGTDGLDIMRRVTAQAPQWLAPGGHLLAETSARQAFQAAAAVIASGLIPHVVSSDELNATVVIGTRPARPGGPGG